MSILLVSHRPYSYVTVGFPVRHGGQLRFLKGRHEHISLPRPIIEAIETAHHSTVEFFTVRITGQGTSLDYLLIPAYGRQNVSELEAVQMRLLMLASIEQILIANHSYLRQSFPRFNGVKIHTSSSR